VVALELDHIVLRRGEPARSAEDLVMGAPAEVSPKQLRQLHIRVVKPGRKPPNTFPANREKYRENPRKAPHRALLVPKQAENSIISGKNFPAGANREFSSGNREAEWGEQGIRSPSTRDRDVFFPKTLPLLMAPEAPAYDAADRSAFPRASLFQAQARAAAVLVDELTFNL
jgi:hypothetical protein